MMENYRLVLSNMAKVAKLPPELLDDLSDLFILQRVLEDMGKKDVALVIENTLNYYIYAIAAKGIAKYHQIKRAIMEKASEKVATTLLGLNMENLDEHVVEIFTEITKRIKEEFHGGGATKQV